MPFGTRARLWKAGLPSLYESLKELDHESIPLMYVKSREKRAIGERDADVEQEQRIICSDVL